MEIEPLLDLLITKGREELLKTLPENSCVSSSRFAIEVLTLAGFRAEPLVVHLVSQINGFTIVGALPKSERDFRLEDSLPNWHGHMVVGIAGYYLDMSLEQIGLVSAWWKDEYDWSWPKKFGQGGYDLIYFKEPFERKDYIQYDSWQKLWKPAYEAISPLIGLAKI